MPNLIRVAVVMIVILFAVACLAPVLAPADPFAVNMAERLQGPSWQHPMGTDQLGRDLFSRILYATRMSVTATLMTVVFCLIVGVGIGSIAGYFGGVTDDILMRLVDIIMAFPGLILPIAITGILGPSLSNIILALILTSWVGYARIMRSCVLTVKECTFVEAAKAMGSSNWEIVQNHILPNAIHPVLVFATFNMSHTLLSIAGLSFLGLGAQPPTPEWGAMLNEASVFMGSAPHLFIFPGLMVMITVLAFNLLGDGLRDLLDPRLKKEVEV